MSLAPAELLFLHDPPDVEVVDAAGATVIALTPTAFEWACERGMAPTVVDDHMDRPAILPEATAYLRWQLDWLRRLDRDTDAKGAVLASAHLIKPAIDSIVVWARILDAIVAAHNPPTLRYVGSGGSTSSPWHAGHLQFWPLLGDRPLAADLLPLIAAHRGAVARVETPHQHLRARPRRPRPGLRPAIRAWVARTLGAWRYFSMRDRGGHRSSCLMLWTSGYGAAEFAAEQRGQGRRLVFLERGGATTGLIDAGRPWAPSTSIPVAPTETTRPLPELDPFLAEIDTWAGVAVGAQLLQSRLTFFLRNVVPAVRDAAAALGPELARQSVVEIAAANPHSIEEFAALLAGARHPEILRTLVQHGDHAFSYDLWLVTETQNVDRVVASDPTVPADMRADAVALGVPVPEFDAGSPRVRRTRRVRPAADAGPVVYVPAALVGDSAVPGHYFEDAWYHRWHRELLAAMVARPDIHFWWKGLPQGDQAIDPIPALITAHDAANVTYHTEPFLRLLPHAGRVVTDFPSTALYEAVHARRPVLALAFPRFAQLRPSAAALFAPVLRICASEAEALEHLAAFLNDDPQRWIVPPTALGA